LVIPATCSGKSLTHLLGDKIWPTHCRHQIPIFGTLGFISTLLFAIPRTQIPGAILLTGYFGGAIVTHVRLDQGLFSLVLFPVYMALLAWGFLWIKNERLRRLILNKS
jgi:hypothetical protein